METIFWLLYLAVIVVFFIFIIKRKFRDENTASRIIAASALIIASLPSVLKLRASIFDFQAKIISLTPVCVYDDFEVPFEEDTVTFYKLGMYIVLEIENGAEVSYISALDITGKIPVSINHYLTDGFANCGMTIYDIQEEYEKNDPYYRIGWVAWPYLHDGEIVLEERQTGYIIFELWEPIPGGQRERGYRNDITDYFGDNSHLPARTHGFPSMTTFCNTERGSGGIPTGLRSVFLSDSVRFSLRLGRNNLNIPKDVFESLILVSKDDWDGMHISRILHRGDEEVQ